MDRTGYGIYVVFSLIDELAPCTVPLLKLDGPGRFKEALDLPRAMDAPSLKRSNRWDVSVSGAGRAVLAGEEDSVALNGIDHKTIRSTVSYRGNKHHCTVEPNATYDYSEGQCQFEEGPSREFYRPGDL